MTPSQRTLVIDNIDWARSLVGAYVRRAGLGHLADDAQGAGFEGLVRAALAWEPWRGVPFRAYAHRRVLGEAMGVARAESYGGKRVVSRALAVRVPPELAVIATPAPQEHAADLHRAALAVAGLPRKTRRVVELMAQENTLSETGAVVGLRKSGAFRHLRAGRAALIAVGIRP